MKKNKKILIIIGTRPEAIKMGPLIRELESLSNIDTKVFLSGQHDELIKPMLKLFRIKVSDILVKRRSNSLNLFCANLLKSLDALFNKETPDMVIIHGDTATTLCASMAAFFMGIKVAHVEAGLRTHDLQAPFPEEFNRVVAGYSANIHFAPTKLASANLRAHGISKNIFVTGNTIVDSVKFVVNRIESSKSLKKKIIKGINLYLGLDLNKQDYILITGHRRENFGKSFYKICKAILKLSKRYPDKLFIYPVHLNPNVQKPVLEILGNSNNIKLIPPQDYLSFVFLLKNSTLVITDSGGIQEECPSLGIPIILMRDKTERPEIKDYPGFRLTGSSIDKIYKNAIDLIENYSLSIQNNPFGDGKASKKITKIIKRVI